MKAVDTNILVYAHRQEAREHQHAASIMREFASGQTPWAIPWPCLFEFHSVVTNFRIWGDVASSPEESWAQISAWTGSPTLRLLAEPSGFVELLGPLINRPRVVGPVVHDGRIAALCLAHGVETLLSRDRDFSLFPELRVDNPF